MEGPPPAALVDVDGVLNRYLMRREEPPWRQRRIQIHPRGPKYTCYLNEEHGPMLLEFAAETGAELIWGTTWEHDANRLIGPLIGLPELPVAPMPPLRGLGDYRDKAEGFIPWLAGRPFIWLEDEESEKQAAGRLADWPHLVILVDPREGLRQHHLDEAAAWLADLAAGRITA